MQTQRDADDSLLFFASDKPPKPALRFDGADEIVMTRAALKDTPVIPRKSTFKPLIAKTIKSDVQDVIKGIKVPESSDAEDPPVPVKPIDGYLKLGLAASVGIQISTNTRELTDTDVSSPA